jgi:hypothetical protein
MSSLRDAMKTVAQNTSKILSPDLRDRVVKALSEMEGKYVEAQEKLRKALFDKVSLENEVLYLKNKLAEAATTVESLQERATKAVVAPPKREKPKAKPKTSTKKTPQKKK